MKEPLLFSSVDKERLREYFALCPMEEKTAHPLALLKYALALFVHKDGKRRLGQSV